jgi:hypothetical protein
MMAAANHVLGQQGVPIREGAQRELSGLPGWLYRTWQDHHLLYALGMVAFLLALGAAIGIASERALTALGFETEESDNTE